MLPLHDTFVSCIGVGKEPLRIPLEDLAGRPYLLLRGSLSGQQWIVLDDRGCLPV